MGSGKGFVWAGLRGGKKLVRCVTGVAPADRRSAVGAGIEGAERSLRSAPGSYDVVNGCGIVFELTPPSSPGGAWTERVLHAFSGQNGDGAIPEAGLVLSSTGILYGTTTAGGTAGRGTVFAVEP